MENKNILGIIKKADVAPETGVEILAYIICCMRFGDIGGMWQSQEREHAISDVIEILESLAHDCGSVAAAELLAEHRGD